MADIPVYSICTCSGRSIVTLYPIQSSSITLATFLPQFLHFPFNTIPKLLSSTIKAVIVVTSEQFPHQTFPSRLFLISFGMESHFLFASICKTPSIIFLPLLNLVKIEQA